MPAAAAIPAIVGVVGAGSSIASGIMGQQGAEDQAKAIKESGDQQFLLGLYQANLEQQRWKRTRKDFEPFRQAGVQALGPYMEMLQSGPGEFEADPGYQFRLAEGNKAIDRASAMPGGGDWAKSLVGYNQNLASSEYDTFMKRYYDRLNAFANAAGKGQSITQAEAGLGAESAARTAQYLSQGTAARGSAYSAAAGARATGYQNLMDSLNQGVQNLSDYYMMRDAGNRYNSPAPYGYGAKYLSDIGYYDMNPNAAPGIGG